MYTFDKFTESHEPRLMSANFLAPGVQPVSGPLEFDCTSGMAQWGIDGNAQYGDCGFAAVDHANVAELGDPTQDGKLFFPEYPDTKSAYFAYGLSIGEVGPPNAPNEPDFGVQNASMLAWCFKNGFINDYMEIPVDQIDWWALQAKGVLIGLKVNQHIANESSQQPRVPWGSSPEDFVNLNEGHDVLYIKGHADGTGAVVTWGFLQPFAEQFRQNITDAWVIGTRNLDFVDSKALGDMLTAMHGTVRS